MVMMVLLLLLMMMMRLWRGDRRERLLRVGQVRARVVVVVAAGCWHLVDGQQGLDDHLLVLVQALKVHLEVALGREAVAAYVAAIGPLARMRTHVDLHGRVAAEYLAAQVALMLDIGAACRRRR